MMEHETRDPPADEPEPDVEETVLTPSEWLTQAKELLGELRALGTYGDAESGRDIHPTVCAACDDAMCRIYRRIGREADRDLPADGLAG